MHDTALDHFLHILTLPDNIPIVGLMVLLFFFTYLGAARGAEERQADRAGPRGRDPRPMQD